jgi:RNA recognition motif-containing protein
MGSKLYVGNLAYSATDDGVETHFAQYGTVVSVALITDRDTGRPKGFGFVEMSSEEEALAAKEALDGSEFGGRTIRVDIAKDRPPRGGGGGYGGGGGRGGYGGGGYGGGGGRW